MSWVTDKALRSQNDREKIAALTASNKHMRFALTEIKHHAKQEGDGWLLEIAQHALKKTET